MLNPEVNNLKLLKALLELLFKNILFWDIVLVKKNFALSVGSLLDPCQISG